MWDGKEVLELTESTAAGASPLNTFTGNGRRIEEGGRESNGNSGGHSVFDEVSWPRVVSGSLPQVGQGFA